MDNTTILFNAVTRTYRNAMVAHIRKCLVDSLGDNAANELPPLFGAAKWDELRENAHQSRSEATGGITQRISDDFELLGVERFFNIFEKFFDILCSKHASKPKKEKALARSTLTNWLKQIKDTRDPIAHSITEDIDFDDAYNTLYAARKALDFCALSDAADQVINAQSMLLGGIGNDAPAIMSVMPPDDEVVVDFVGRGLDLEILEKWFDSDSKRFALSGEGGRGKSAIAYAFARSIARRKNHRLDAVIWLSAKRRRFIEGRTVQVGRPDFHDKESAICKIVEAYGESTEEDASNNESFALELLQEFPALLVVDDIDTVEGQGEDAIEFLMMAVPERTQSRVLFTSRRELFGAQSFTHQVLGLENGDDLLFIESRCDLFGIEKKPIIDSAKKLVETTDGSPLYIEDLLRLSQAGLDINEAIGIWSNKGGEDARLYAIKREYEHLTDDAKQVLLALALQGPSTNDELTRGMNWPIYRLAQVLQELRKMFLLPHITQSEDKNILALNRNMQLLVMDAFADTDALKRTRRLMQAAAGELTTSRDENRQVGQIMMRYDRLRRQSRFDEAIQILQKSLKDYPARVELHSALGFIYMKRKNYVEAKEQFTRAHELGIPKPDTYWHWATIEADHEEWIASSRAALLGLAHYPNEAGLRFRDGYAKHRRGRELIMDGKKPEGMELCTKAETNLKRLVESGPDSRLLPRILRSLVLNAEITENIPALKQHLQNWKQACPEDRSFDSEFDRLRKKFPLEIDLTARQ